MFKRNLLDIKPVSKSYRVGNQQKVVLGKMELGIRALHKVLIPKTQPTKRSKTFLEART